MPGLMELLSYAGNALDLPASSLRDLVTGSNPFDQWATPFSSDNRTSGRDLLNPIFGKNKETGMSGWLDDPMEGVADVLGFGAEMLLDPLNAVSGTGVVRALKGRKAAKSANKVIAAENASNAGKYGYVNAKLAGQADELVNPITQQAPQKLLGYTPERPTVYHGGHDWSASATPENPYGMFDVGRLKTGEGANAYGPGAYFAEAESTSQRYKGLVQDRLKNSKNPIGEAYGVMSSWLPGELVRGTSDPEGINEFLMALKNNNWLGLNPKLLRHRDKMDELIVDRVGVPEDVLAAYDRLNVPPPKARLYQLDMPPEAADRFVSWNNPMKEQPAGVQDAIRERVPGFEDLATEYVGVWDKLGQAKTEMRKLKTYDPDYLDRPEGMRWLAAASQARNAQRSIVEDIMRQTGLGQYDAQKLLENPDDLMGESVAQVLLGGSPQSVPVTNATSLPQLGVSGTKNLAASTGRNTYNYAIWDQDLLNQMRIRAIDGQRVPINPTTLVQQIAQPLPQVADSTLMRSMNPMRPLQQLPGLAAPAATSAVYNVLARQNSYGGVM